MSDELQEKVNAVVTDNSVGAVPCDRCGGLTFLGALRKAVETNADELPLQVLQSAVNRLVDGAVLCAAVFIVMSFVFPDRGNGALTALIPVLTVAKLGHEILARRKKDGK